MATQSFLVTALPRSVDPAETVHVSLFVAHRLTPDGAEGVVGDFTGVVDWPSQLAAATIRLTGTTGGGATVDIPVTADLSLLEPTTWAGVFPPDLAVRPWATRDYTDVPWRTFPAHRMQQHSLLAHAAGMFASPIDPPTVAGNPLTRPALAAIGLGQFVRSRLRVEDLFHPEFERFDEQATAFLDDMSGGGFVGRAPSTAAEATPLGLMAADVHAARRYYQPEDEPEYRDQPDPDAVPVPLHRNDPDFHERASMLGDLSALLRRLGLVIDLRIDDLAAMADVVDLQADIEIDGFGNTVASQPRTACQIEGHRCFAPTASGDYLGPLLRLGDEERYAVLDLDPDAQALKLENYLRNMPRLIATENNGDRVTSAPHALRSSGFSVARVDRAERLHQRLDGAPGRAADVLAGTASPFHIEDVTRGVRLEVWDDESGLWHSLHRRRVDVSVDGVGAVLVDAADIGFLQGASLTRADSASGAVAGTPYHAHEVLAGWEGWSLSAPRPGRPIAHVDGDEVVLDEQPADPNPVNPVRTISRVEPGTLPWLRFGRNYAFRAWAVDLSGNSSPHPVAGPETAPAPPPVVTGVAADVAAERLGAIRRDATASYRVPATSGSVEALRGELRAMRPAPVVGPQPGRGAPGLEVTDLVVTGIDDIDRTIRDRVASRVRLVGRVAAPRRAAVETAFAAAALTTDPLMERVDARVPAATFSAALSAAVNPHDVGGSVAAVIAALSDTVTTPRPFLRWGPVVEPVVVPRHAYTEAESQLTIVIRSGVEPPADGALDVTIVPPAEYADAVKAAFPELDLRWRGDSQRHLLPPKTTQLEAEQAGMFDDAFGSGDADALRRALAISLRESGTLFDTTVADVATPGARSPQPGVTLHTTPTAEEPVITDPALLRRGDPPTRGQYVAHDVDDLTVPYLPDPFASGLTLMFPDAGKGDVLAGLFGVESVTLRYRGGWPETHPVRLVLETGTELHGAVDDAGHELRIALPPGEQLRFRLASALDRERLAHLGLWRSLPGALQAIDLLADAAADGWFWWLTPATEVRLVHAVPRPVELPRPTVMVAQRFPDATDAAILGAVDVHGASTERLDLEASWREWIDDVAKPEPIEVEVRAAVAQVPIGEDDDLVVTGRDDVTLPMPDGSSLHVRSVVHQLGDTRHRDIDYRYRASTRFREYFDPRVLPEIDDVSVVGPSRLLDVPSTARPPKPVVRDVLPLFRWYTATEPDQPFGIRRERQTGLRIYLDRPWYATGNGELLGVVLAFGSDAPVAGHVSQWGADPVYLQQGPARRGALPLVDVAHLIGLDDRSEPGRPVGPMRLTKLVDVAGQPTVAVLGYRPEYDRERRLWFVDVAFDPGTAFWPFVRLAVARLQPSSLPGRDLSAIIHCDFVALPPQRSATVSRPDEHHVRVVVTGPIGIPSMGGGARGLDFAAALAASRTMRVRLERRVPEISTDLGWETIATDDLPILGLDGTIVSWTGELALPVPVAPARPGAPSDLRVTIEEWERVPADPASPEGPLGVEARIVYVDHVELS